MRELNPDPFPPTFYVDYLNQEATQKAIGAYQNYSESANTPYQAFTDTGDDNREEGIIATIRKLLKQGVYVTLV